MSVSLARYTRYSVPLLASSSATTSQEVCIGYLHPTYQCATNQRQCALTDQPAIRAQSKSSTLRQYTSSKECPDRRYRIAANSASRLACLFCTCTVFRLDAARFVRPSQTTSTFRWRWSGNVDYRTGTFGSTDATNAPFLESIQSNRPLRLLFITCKDDGRFHHETLWKFCQLYACHSYLSRLWCLAKRLTPNN